TRWPRDWSSDVCSSDLTDGKVVEVRERPGEHDLARRAHPAAGAEPKLLDAPPRIVTARDCDSVELFGPAGKADVRREPGPGRIQIGRASCRERGGDWGR